MMHANLGRTEQLQERYVLLKKALAGYLQMQSEFVADVNNEFGGLIRRLARNFNFESSDDIDDVCQLVLMRLAFSTSEIENLKGWLLTTTKNLATDLWNEQRLNPSDSSNVPPGVLRDQAEAPTILRAMCTATQCDVLVPYLVYGREISEIASRLDKKRATVRKHFSDGLMRIKNWISS